MPEKQTERRKILDEGFVTRSLIENEVVMKKCELYSEMAKDPAVKSFFKDQSKQLGDAQTYIQDSMSDLR